MALLFSIITTYIISINVILCFESDSSEINQIEFTSPYDAIIISDIADIINEFDDNANSLLKPFVNSDSDSNENIEDLLSEYQRYLKKAHKQRKNYLDKSKNKNKIPLVRHEKHTKTKPANDVKYDQYSYVNSYYDPNIIKFPQPLFNHPMDLFRSINPHMKYVEVTTPRAYINRDKLTKIEKITNEENKFILSPAYGLTKSFCFCKNHKIPCKCNCKQCLLPYERISQNPTVTKNMFSPKYSSLINNSQKSSEYDKLDFITENVLNIRVKVDIQLLPTSQDNTEYNKSQKIQTLNMENGVSKEVPTTTNYPFPHFNFPIPVDLFGFKKLTKINNFDSTLIHKIMVHKKKKEKPNNNNKKHRKKFITFHNINLEPQLQHIFGENINLKNYNTSIPYHKLLSTNLTTNDKSQSSVIHQPDQNFNQTANKIDEYIIINKNQTEENFSLMANLTNNGTENAIKIEYSIETEYMKNNRNTTTENPSTTVINLRRKRETAPQKATTEIKTEKYFTTDTTILPSNVSDIVNNTITKIEKGFLKDSELLFWPNNTRDHTDIHSKNITTLILEKENNKGKLNISKETIRYNHTNALEKAIFGEVDWDDVDTVTPAFISFVGKYIRGVLTFCSESKCHSMKCVDKTCVHRICKPGERLKHRGHCTGSNNTDSVASMESIMDLPSNVAFEIVDILQERMLGKLFGKATICIGSKCISFVAHKKHFVKSKCLIKELNVLGHCSYIKKF